MSLPLGSNACAPVVQHRGEGVRPRDPGFPGGIARRFGVAAYDSWDVDRPPERRIARDAHRHTRVRPHDLFFFKQKTAYEIGLGIPAEPLFRSSVRSGIHGALK